MAYNLNGRIRAVLSDEEYSKLQWALIINPQAGAIIPGTKGLRKLRWLVSDKGKRGGLRIIYYWYMTNEKIYMLFVYKKSETGNLTTQQLKILINYLKENIYEK